MLLLFDIDGTLLIRATDAHSEALHTAIHDVDHVEVPDASVPTAGRTDLAIMRSLLTLAGVDAKKIDDGVQARCDAACIAYARLCPDDLSAYVAPDVPDALERLAADGHVIGLVTGNLEPIARL
jgi:phosphoglycolate phosphatase-like HAD superfamily hydrolase